MKGQEKPTAVVTLELYKDRVEIKGLDSWKCPNRQEFLWKFNQVLEACRGILRKPDLTFPWWETAVHSVFNNLVAVPQFRPGDPGVVELTEITEIPVSQLGSLSPIPEKGPGWYAAIIPGSVMRGRRGRRR